MGELPAQGRAKASGEYRAAWVAAKRGIVGSYRETSRNPRMHLIIGA
jgi:hypothetical protein